MPANFNTLHQDSIQQMFENTSFNMAQRTTILDSNILLCALISRKKLSPEIQQQLINPEKTVYFSAASIWEIATKSSLNKVDFDFLPQDIHTLALQVGFTEVPIRSNYAFEIAKMA